jgi:high-affinity iron transporter
MLAIAIIVFREVLEAALIVSIVMAASAGIAGRNRWVGYGLLGGVSGAATVALFAASIAETFAGVGQELLNASILFLAVVMLGWHNVWMAQHGRELAQKARAVSHAVTAGTRPLSALALITGAAVLREGSETVLFVYSVAAGATDGLTSMISGALVGMAGGIAVGIALYAGLLRMPVDRLFAVTSWMVLLLAAGLAAQGAGFLTQADVLPSLGSNLWDTSAVLSESSILGKVLHTLIGYVAQPSGIQLLFYTMTLAVIALLMWLVTRRASVPKRQMSALAAIVTAGSLLGWPNAAWADFKVRSPIVEYREFEFEHNGAVTFDHRTGLGNDQSYTYSLGYGLTPFWKIELEAETGAPPGERLSYRATTLENTFELTPQGKYWADLGFFAEYSQAAQRGAAHTVKFGPIAQKETPGFGGYNLLHTLNLFFERELGPNSTSRTGFAPAFQSRIALHPLLEPGFEIYGSIDDLGRTGKFRDQQYNAGPVLSVLTVSLPLARSSMGLDISSGSRNQRLTAPCDGSSNTS